MNYFIIIDCAKFKPWNVTRSRQWYGICENSEASSSFVRMSCQVNHVKWASCYQGMPCPQVADSWDGRQIWRL